MISASRRRANTLIRFALMVAPPKRRDWALAMKAEIEHLPDPAVVSFAFGCLWATIRARAVSAAFILQTARWTLVLGAITWSALNLWLAGRLSATGAASPAIFAYVSAAIYGLGGLITARFGLRAMAALVTPLLMLISLIAFSADAFLPQSAHNKFYQALALEDSVMLLMALLIALGVSGWVANREIVN